MTTDASTPIAGGYGEAARLAELRAHRILDTSEEEVFDRITAFASQLFSTPIALISLIDEHRQWFKSHHGLALRETPREIAFCNHAIAGDEVMVVADAMKDERFANNPLVTGEPGFRFYAGAPIKTRLGHRLGTVCVIDTRPRARLQVDGSAALQALADLANAELELRQAMMTARDQAALGQRLNSAILLVERVETLETLPQVTAEVARDVLLAQPVRVSLDLRAFGGPVVSASVPVKLPGEPPSRLDEQPIVGTRGTFGEVAFVRPDMASEDGSGRQMQREPMQQLARAVANRVEQLLLLRDAHAAHERLARAQRLESLGQLTGGVAHDFNNLLTVIMGNAEVLVQRLPEEGMERELAAMIDSAAQRGAELTQRLLAFSRKQPLVPVALDLNRLLTGLLPLLNRTLGEHIDIDFVPGDGPWQTRVDPGQLENVLVNLVVNARDAMPRGGRVTLRAANLTIDAAAAAAIGDLPPGDYVELSVVDTGSGIAPQDLDRVFEPFFTTKEPGRGTGLGLAMVYGFIKQSGGHVALTSALGAGTAVRILLPRWRGEAVAPSPERSVDEIPTGRGQLILLVEDEPLVRSNVRAQLVELGYCVLEAANGPDAVAWLRREPQIELLLTDMVMPGGMNGRDVALAARAQRPGLPVLYTTGYSAIDVVHQGKLEPGEHLLGKPYRRAELARKVRDALADTSAAAV